MSFRPADRPNDEVRVQKLSHVVAERLRAQIVQGERKPGDKLPSETELLQQFKVSRPTVREALRILEVESFISMGRGMRSGATVLAPSTERAAHYAAMVLATAGTTLGELHETRLILEPTLVMQLTRIRSKKLLDSLEHELDAGELALTTGELELAVRKLNAFHTMLIEASGNRALRLIVGIVRSLSDRSIDVLAETPRGGEVALRRNLQKTHAAYQQLLDLMKSGNDQEAQAFWRKYMERAQQFLERTGLGARKIPHLP
jgi:DNA-binding FadR family transcriptional regulator